jgi:hypothetical protein
MHPSWPPMLLATAAPAAMAPHPPICVKLTGPCRPCRPQVGAPAPACLWPPAAGAGGAGHQACGGRQRRDGLRQEHTGWGPGAACLLAGTAPLLHGCSGCSGAALGWSRARRQVLHHLLEASACLHHANRPLNATPLPGLPLSTRHRCRSTSWSLRWRRAAAAPATSSARSRAGSRRWAWPAAWRRSVASRCGRPRGPCCRAGSGAACTRLGQLLAQQQQLLLLSVPVPLLVLESVVPPHINPLLPVPVRPNPSPSPGGAGGGLQRAPGEQGVGAHPPHLLHHWWAAAAAGGSRCWAADGGS